MFLPNWPLAEQAAREQAAFSLVRNEDGDPVIGPADAAGHNLRIL